MQVELLRRDPPFFRITLPVASEHPAPPFDYWALLGHLADQSTRDLLAADFRAVEPCRLDTVLRSGVDVVPPDAPIFVGPFDKAWEYGGWPKLVLAFDPRLLGRTFREERANIPPQELERLRSRFPTMLRSVDGERLWLSRLAGSDRRIASDYEIAYGRWIPGNPRDALRAVLLFTSPDRGALTDGLRGALDDAEQTERLPA